MNTKEVLPLLGSMVTALAASACCTLPLILGAASAGTVGLDAALAPYRPYLMGASFLLLGTGFYRTYRPRKAACCGVEQGCAPEKASRARRLNEVILWLVTLFILGSLAYPWIASYEVSQASSATPLRAVPKAKTVIFAVGNMTCAECALSIAQALKRTPGVYDARVDIAAKRTTIRYDASRVSAYQLRATIERAGFSVATSGDHPGDKKVENKQASIPLVALFDETPLKDAFNQARDNTRLVLLVSPT